MTKVIWIEDDYELRNLIEHSNTVVVDFTAPSWCRPCQQFAPHYDRAAENLPDVTFVAVDVDKAPWAMEDYGVRGVPTVKLFNENGVTEIKSRAVVPLIKEINNA